MPHAYGEAELAAELERWVEWLARHQVRRIDYIGVSRELLIGKTVDDVAAQEFADLSMRADEALLDQSGTQSYESSLL